MRRQELALKNFKEGYDCSKSILSTYISEMNLDANRAQKMSEPFGTFLGKPKEVCGAVEASLCVINYHHNQNDLESEKAKRLIEIFKQSFIENHGSILCRELIGTDLSTYQGKIKALELDICDRYGGAEKYLSRLSKGLNEINIAHKVINSKLPKFLPSWLRVIIFNLQVSLFKENKFYFSLERITCPGCLSSWGWSS